MIFTAHALQRLKERLSWSAATAARMYPVIVAEGLERAHTKGSLRRYLDKGMATHRKGADLRIYGHHIFIIEQGSVITVLDLPKRWHALVDEIRTSALSVRTGGAP